MLHSRNIYPILIWAGRGGGWKMSKHKTSTRVRWFACGKVTFNIKYHSTASHTHTLRWWRVSLSTWDGIKEKPKKKQQAAERNENSSAIPIPHTYKYKCGKKENKHRIKVRISNVWREPAGNEENTTNDDEKPKWEGGKNVIIYSFKWYHKIVCN